DREAVRTGSGVIINESVTVILSLLHPYFCTRGVESRNTARFSPVHAIFTERCDLIYHHSEVAVIRSLRPHKRAERFTCIELIEIGIVHILHLPLKSHQLIG